MSREYPCVYYDNEKCTLHGSDPENIDWCVMGPCSHETPSNADHIRAMSDKELAEFLRNCFWGRKQNARLFALKEWLKQPYEEDKHD